MKTKDTNVRVLSYGTCTCLFAPMGQGGLEGYVAKGMYKYQKVTNETEIYFRVYPDQSDKYYETTGKNTFNQYFEINKD